MSKVYYNEIDKYIAKWSKNLISSGQIAIGDVDERSIENVRPQELSGYAQCHFFAGIGVWSYALRLAGWPDNRPVWTGSCPCQPFSKAGKGAGFADERHLWPAFHYLIGERRPPIIFGEQVADRNGLSWFDIVQADLEDLGYACGAVITPAAGFGAPHIRHRLFWVAYANSERSQGWIGKELRERSGEVPLRESGSLHWPFGKTNGFWRDADWLHCKDKKWRPVESGTFPLADRTPSHVGRLRAYGNAIVPQQAAEFIKAAMEILTHLE